MLQACNKMSRATTTNIGDGHGYRWAIGITGYTLFNTSQAPNDRQFPVVVCRLDGDPLNYPDSAFVFAFSGAHPGGINVALADDSVRFVRDGMNRTIWGSLGTKAGGEVIGADSE